MSGWQAPLLEIHKERVLCAIDRKTSQRDQEVAKAVNDMSDPVDADAAKKGDSTTPVHGSGVPSW